MSFIVLCIVITIVSWFSWNVIHEMSHILAAKLFGNVKSWSIKPYPHKYNDSFRFAGAYWEWEENGQPPKFQRALISLAPRVSNLIAAIFLSASTVFPYAMVSLLGMIHPFVMLFLLFGMADLFVGSIGMSETSDLRRAATRLDISPWIIRLLGFAVILMVVVPLCLMLLK